MQEFKIKKSAVWTLIVCLIFFLLFTALGLSLPFFPDQDADSMRESIIVSSMVVMVFAPLVIWVGVVLKNISRATLVLDDDGIWYKHIGKETGLVIWGQIVEMKERSLRQRFDLIDSNSESLLRVEYQLDDFEHLRYLLSEKIATAKQLFSQKKFKKSIFYHLIYAVLIVCAISAAWFFGSEFKPLVIYGGVSLFIVALLFEYAKEITSIEIRGNTIQLNYLFRKKSIPTSEILDIQLSDVFSKGNRYSQVSMIVKEVKEPYLLRQLGVDANKLYSVLSDAVDRDKANINGV